MSDTAAHGPAAAPPSGFRPLPPRPNLEFERKQDVGMSRCFSSSAH